MDLECSMCHKTWQDDTYSLIDNPDLGLEAYKKDFDTDRINQIISDDDNSDETINKIDSKKSHVSISHGVGTFFEYIIGKPMEFVANCLFNFTKAVGDVLYKFKSFLLGR